MADIPRAPLCFPIIEITWGLQGRFYDPEKSIPTMLLILYIIWEIICTCNWEKDHQLIVDGETINLFQNFFAF